MFEELKKLPDFDRLPLPKDWYTKFNIPPPKIPTLRESLKLHYETQLAYINTPTPPEIEVRKPAEGGVRPLIDVTTPELKVYHGKTLKDLDSEGNLLENGETAPSEESK